MLSARATLHVITHRLTQEDSRFPTEKALTDEKQDVTKTTGLQPGDEIRCPNCPQWHAVYRRIIDIADKAHPHAQQILYFTCRGRQYSAGPELEGRSKSEA